MPHSCQEVASLAGEATLQDLVAVSAPGAFVPSPGSECHTPHTFSGDGSAVPVGSYKPSCRNLALVTNLCHGFSFLLAIDCCVPFITKAV